MKIVLASSSPRRLKLLSGEGFDFEVEPPEIDESRLEKEPPEDYVRRVAAAKARVVAGDDNLVIAADTVVVLGDEFLNKPVSEHDAKSILRKLSGQTHTVYTGLSIICGACRREDTSYDKTRVRFNVLTDEAILEYIKTGEPLDKAGAYGIQGMGSFLVKDIDGELDTVIGFPMKLFKKMIEEHRECLNRI